MPVASTFSPAFVAAGARRPAFFAGGSEFGRADLGGTPDALVDVLAALRAATTHYAGMLRREGVRPERLLPEVKALVRDVMCIDAAGDPEVVQEIEQQVVRWSLAAYYGEV